MVTVICACTLTLRSSVADAVTGSVGRVPELLSQEKAKNPKITPPNRMISDFTVMVYSGVKVPFLTLTFVAHALGQCIDLIFCGHPVGQLTSVTEPVLFGDEVGGFGDHFHAFCGR